MGNYPKNFISFFDVLDKNKRFGYDARNDVFVDMVKSGIVDPTLVVTSALRHAVSAADNLLSMGCAMHSIEESYSIESFKDLSE